MLPLQWGRVWRLRINQANPKMSNRSETKEWLAAALADGQITRQYYDERIARMKHRKKGAGAAQRRAEKRKSKLWPEGMRATADDLKPFIP